MATRDYPFRFRAAYQCSLLYILILTLSEPRA